MIRRFFRWLFHLGEGVVAGLWLLALYAFTIWIVVGSLSAIQVRQDLSAASQSFTFQSVTEAKKRYVDQMMKIQEDADRQAQEADTEQQLTWELESTLTQIAGSVEPKLDLTEYWIWDYPSSTNFVQRQEKCRVLGVEAASIDQVCAWIAHYNEKTRELSGVNLAEFSDKLDAIQMETQAKIENLQKAHPLLNYYAETEFWQGAGYEWLLYMPQQVLVLFLTGAMGMLGSVITMTWSYVREDGGLTLRRFIVLPLVGSMSAFIILVFVSAGQLTLTAGADNNDLNPFTISFLAIISGLLSERAYSRMADVGSNFFRVDDGQPRWAIGLKAAMADAGVTTTELARHLYIAEEEVTRIVDEAVTATQEQQRLIAACVRLPMRDIFTDVPPEGAAAQAVDHRSEVPDLIGLDPDALVAALGAAGLELGARREEPADPSVSPGSVIRQNPGPGERLPQGAGVDVTLAAGETSQPETPAAGS